MMWTLVIILFTANGPVQEIREVKITSLECQELVRAYEQKGISSYCIPTSK